MTFEHCQNTFTIQTFSNIVINTFVITCIFINTFQITYMFKHTVHFSCYKGWKCWWCIFIPVKVHQLWHCSCLKHAQFWEHKVAPSNSIWTAYCFWFWNDLGKPGDYGQYRPLCPHYYLSSTLQIVEGQESDSVSLSRWLSTFFWYLFNFFEK